LGDTVVCGVEHATFDTVTSIRHQLSKLDEFLRAKEWWYVFE